MSVLYYIRLHLSRLDWERHSLSIAGRHVMRGTCGKELQVASRIWEWPPDDNQRENGDLGPTTTVDAFCPPEGAHSGSFHSQASDETTVLPDTWWQAGNSLSGGPSSAGAGLQTHRNCEVSNICVVLSHWMCGKWLPSNRNKYRGN